MSVSVPGWRAKVAAYIANEARPVEKYGHQPRLYELCLQIGQGQTYDDDIVYAAAWLHDLGVFEGHRPADRAALPRWDNVAYALERTPALLAEFGFPAEKVNGVLESIRTHQPHGLPQTIEATILRDADILEQLGAVGILRTVCKTGRDTRFQTFTQAATSLHTALESLPALLHLPSSKLLAAPRIQMHREFLNAIQAESKDNLH
jgi:uncharacterized protein